MNRFLYSLALLAATTLSLACGSDPTCSVVDNSDGTSTIRCPGTEPITFYPKEPGDPECTMVSGPEPGDRTIHCTDGTEIRFEDGIPVFPGSGSLAGTAQLFGGEDHSGITIRLEGTDFRTSAGADGSYRIDGIPAGFYSVIFEAEGRSPQIVKNIAIIAGVYDLGTIQLRGGRRVTREGRALLSPRGDSALGIYSRDATSWVDLWKVDGLEPMLLGYAIVNYGYDATGSAVFTLDLETFVGKLRHWSVDTGESVLVAEHVADARYAGKRLVFQHQPPGEPCHLEVWTPGEGTSKELGPCIYKDFWTVSPDHTAIAYHRPDGMRVVQDLATLETWELATEVLLDPWKFSPSGRYVAFVDRHGELKVLDRRTGGVRTLGSNADISATRFAPVGERLLTTTRPTVGTSDLWLFDLDEEASSLLVQAPFFDEWKFSRDGKRLAGWASRRDGPAQLLAIDTRRPELIRTFPLPDAQGFQWFPDGTDIQVDTGEGLYIWEVDGQAEPILVSDVWAPARAWSPDGELVAAARREGVTVFDRRLRTVSDISLIGSSVPAMVWLPEDQGLLIRKENRYDPGLVWWSVASRQSPTPLLNRTFKDVIPDRDGRGFTYIQCETENCEQSVLGHFDLETKKILPLDGQVSEVQTRSEGMLYLIVGGDREGWYFAPRP